MFVSNPKAFSARKPIILEPVANGSQPRWCDVLGAAMVKSCCLNTPSLDCVSDMLLIRRCSQAYHHHRANFLPHPSSTTINNRRPTITAAIGTTDNDNNQCYKDNACINIRIDTQLRHNRGAKDNGLPTASTTKHSSNVGGRSGVEYGILAPT